MAGAVYSDALLEEVRERLLALIAPNAPESAAQRSALEAATEAQAAYEAAHGEALDAARRGVVSFSVGGYSERYGEGGGRERLSPYARALLENAGLLRRSLPVARRLP